MRVPLLRLVPCSTPAGSSLDSREIITGWRNWLLLRNSAAYLFRLRTAASFPYQRRQDLTHHCTRAANVYTIAAHRACPATNSRFASPATSCLPPSISLLRLAHAPPSFAHNLPLLLRSQARVLTPTRYASRSHMPWTRRYLSWYCSTLVSKVCTLV